MGWNHRLRLNRSTVTVELKARLGANGCHTFDGNYYHNVFISFKKIQNYIANNFKTINYGNEISSDKLAWRIFASSLSMWTRLFGEFSIISSFLAYQLWARSSCTFWVSNYSTNSLFYIFYLFQHDLKPCKVT